MPIPSLKVGTTKFTPVNFTPTEYKGNVLDYTILQNSLAKEEERRNKLAEQSSLVKQEIGKLRSSMNEAESEFINNYAQEIEDKINASAAIGDVGRALRTAKESVGEIAKDPRIIGRIRSQAKYDEWEKKVQTYRDNGKIDEDTKEYLYETNPYNYKDSFDANGNFVEGTPFKPTTDVYDNISIASVIKLAADYINPDIKASDYEKGGLNEDGTHTIKGGSKQVEKKTVEEIQQNLESLLRTDGNLNNQLQQKYNVSIWKLNKLKTAYLSLPANSFERKNAEEMYNSYKKMLQNEGCDVTAPNGAIMSYNEFVQHNVFDKVLMKSQSYIKESVSSKENTTKAGTRGVGGYAEKYDEDNVPEETQINIAEGLEVNKKGKGSTGTPTGAKELGDTLDNQ